MRTLKLPGLGYFKNKMYFCQNPVKIMTQILYTLDVSFSNYNK